MNFYKILLLTSPALLFLQSRGLGDVDIIYQVKLGLNLIEGKSISDLLPILADSKTNHGQLSQMLFAIFYRIGGWDFVRLLNSCVIWLTISIGLYFSHKKQEAIYNKRAPSEKIDLNKYYICIFLTSIFILIQLLPYAWVRMQTFSFLFFIVYLNKLTNFIESPNKKINLTILFILLIIWQNFHPSTLIAIPPLVSIILITHKKFNIIKDCLALLVAIILVQFLTIDGFKSLILTSSNLKISKDIMFVSEWLSPLNLQNQHIMGLFLFGVITLLLLAIKNSKKISLVDLSISLACLSAALYASRFVPYFILSTIPLWLNIFINQFNKIKVKCNIFIYLVAASLFLSIVISFKYPLKHEPELSWDNLNFHLPKEKNTIVFNCKELSGVLSFIRPYNLSLYFSGHYYLISADNWKLYIEASDGRMSADSFDKNFPADLAVLCNSYQSNLKNIILQSGRWYIISEDAYTSILSKK